VCGRYSLALHDPSEIRARFCLDESVEVRTRYNIAPADRVLAVVAGRDGRPRGELLRWGLVPSFARSPHTGLKLINARVETVQRRPVFRRAFERWRCLIVADGFYEWRRLERGAAQPFHVTRADGELFAFAGLWSIWHAPDGSLLRSCAILTGPANAAVAPLHDRMPVILKRDHERAWLDAATPREELVRMLGGLEASQTALAEVSTAVNDVRCDGPECLRAPAQQAPAQPLQGVLF